MIQTPESVTENYTVHWNALFCPCVLNRKCKRPCISNCLLYSLISSGSFHSPSQSTAAHHTILTILNRRRKMQITWQDPQREDRGVISLTSELVWFTLAEVMSLLFSVTLGPVNWTLSPTLWNVVKVCIQTFLWYWKHRTNLACDFLLYFKIQFILRSSFMCLEQNLSSRGKGIL